MDRNQDLKVAIIGECMLEMSAAHDHYYQLAFAGDTYNVAVYMKRQLNDHAVRVEYVTALGDDSYSQQMVAVWQQEGIDSHHVRHMKDKLPGLYTIETDQHGERQFYYYRSSAAVKDLFIGDEGLRLSQTLIDYDYIFFSGITLAVLNPSSRDILISTIKKAHQAGCIVCFDNNYRQRLWESKAQAQTVITEILPYVSIGLPSFSDAQELFGDTSAKATYDRWYAAGVKQIVVKQGAQGYWVGDSCDCQHVAVTAVTQVDTTAAGDSFDGVFIASLINGDNVVLAASKAARAAAIVVGHKGAIIDSELF